MLDWVLGKKKKRKTGGKKKPSYEEAKLVAAKGDAKARAELAAHIPERVDKLVVVDLAARVGVGQPGDRVRRVRVRGLRVGHGAKDRGTAGARGGIQTQSRFGTPESDAEIQNAR